MAEILPLLLLNAVLLPLLLAKSKDQSECVQMWLKKRPELLDRFQKNQISWLCDRTEEWMTKALNPGKSFDDTLTPLQRNYLNQLRTCKSVDCFENRTAFCTGPNNSHADSTSKPHTGWVPKPLNPKRKTPKNENKVELDDIDLSTIDDVNVDDLLKDDLGKPDKNIKRDLMARVCQQIFNSTDSHLNKTEDKSVRNRYNRYKTKCTKVIQELEKRHETLDSWLSDKMDQNLDDSDLTAIDSFNENISPDKTSQAERFKVAKFCTKILSPGQKLSDHKKLSNLARDKLQKNLLKWRSKCQKIDKNLKKDQHSFADWLIKSSDTAANQTSDDEKRRNLAQLCLKVLKSTTSAEAFPNAKASDEVKHQQFINWRRKCLEIQERMESLNITLNHWLNQNHTDNKSETHNGTSSAIITSTSNPIVVENNVTNSNNSQRNEKSKDHEEKGKAKSDNKNEENNKERGKSGDKNKGGGKDGEDRKTEGKGGKNEKHDEEQKKEEKSKSDKKSKEKDQKNGNNGQHKGEEKKEEKGKPDKKSDAKGGNGQKPRSKRQTTEIPDVADLSGFIEANLKPSADVPQVADIRARRKEYRMMTPSERQKLHAAFNRLKTEKIDGTSKYDLLVVFHVPEEAPGAHWGPAFLPFHRELLKQVEVALRNVDPTVALPYWDSTLDEGLPTPKDSILWTSEFFGNGDNHVTTGPFANWSTTTELPSLNDGKKKLFRDVGGSPFGGLYKPSDLDYVLSRKTFSDLTACVDPTVELTHGVVHMFVGGFMAEIGISPNDPVFFFHHCFVDFLFEEFRQTVQTKALRETDYPSNDKACSNLHYPTATMKPFSIRNMDGLSSTYTSTLYHYDPRPTCNENNPDCGSPYIFCSPKFRCLSKLRPGGNCKGFEGTQICYNGTCKDGKCVADEIPSVTAGPTVLLETTTTLATVIQASTVTTAQLNTTYIAATATTETLTTTNKTEVTPAVTPIPSNPSTNDIFTTSPIETTTVSSFVVASTSQNDINLTSTTNIISVEQITSTITNFSSTTASFDFGTPAFPSVGTQPPTIPAIPGTVAQTTAAQSTTNERGSNLSVIASTIAYSTSEITQFTNPAITTQKGSEVTESVQPTLPSTPFVSAVGSTDSIAIATSISLIPPTVPLPTESNSSILATTPSIPTVEGTNLQTTVVAPITSDRAVQQTGGIESTTVATVATEVQFITRYPAIPTLETSTAQTPPTAASTTIPIETIAPGFTTKIIASPEIPTSTVVTTASPVVISTQAIIIDGSTAEPSSLRSVWFPFTVQRGQGYYKGSVPNAKVTCSGQNVPPGFTSITAGLQWQTPKFPGYTGATVCQARDPALSYGNLTVVLVEVQDAAGQPCKATCLSTKGTYAACSGRVRLSPNAFYSDLNTFRPDAEEALKATWATNTGLVKRRLPDYLVFQCA